MFESVHRRLVNSAALGLGLSGLFLGIFLIIAWYGYFRRIVYPPDEDEPRNAMSSNRHSLPMGDRGDLQYYEQESDNGDDDENVNNNNVDANALIEQQDQFGQLVESEQCNSVDDQNNVLAQRYNFESQQGGDQRNDSDSGDDENDSRTDNGNYNERRRDRFVEANARAVRDAISEFNAKTDDDVGTAGLTSSKRNSSNADTSYWRSVSRNLGERIASAGSKLTTIGEDDGSPRTRSNGNNFSNFMNDGLKGMQFLRPSNAGIPMILKQSSKKAPSGGFYRQHSEDVAGDRSTSATSAVSTNTTRSRYSMVKGSSSQDEDQGYYTPDEDNASIPFGLSDDDARDDNSDEEWKEVATERMELARKRANLGRSSSGGRQQGRMRGPNVIVKESRELQIQD